MFWHILVGKSMAQIASESGFCHCRGLELQRLVMDSVPVRAGSPRCVERQNALGDDRKRLKYREIALNMHVLQAWDPFLPTKHREIRPVTESKTRRPVARTCHLGA